MLTLDLTSRLVDMALRIARYPQDAYQRIISFTASNTILGAGTNLQSQQLAVQRFLSEGINGFVDKSGRNWRIGTYAEMAGRTAVNRAFNDAGVWRMQQVGVNLITVVGALDSCSKCAPWVGKILSTDGSTGTVVVQHATSDEHITVQIIATLDAARGAGLMHPNCRHRAIAYLPGLTIPQESQEYDPQAEVDREKQREIERNIRKAKREVATAKDPQQIQRAQGKVKARQAQMREHIKVTGRARASAREQLHFADGKGATGSWSRPTPPKQPKPPAPTVPAAISTPRPTAPTASAYRPGTVGDYRDYATPEIKASIAAHYDGTTINRNARNSPELYSILHAQGFDGLPALVDSVDDLGQGTRVYRVLSDEKTETSSSFDREAKKWTTTYKVERTAAELAQAFKTGDLFVGRGMYGGGTYMSDRLDNLAQYAGGVTMEEAQVSGAVIDAAIDPAANIKHFASRAEYIAWVQTERDLAKSALPSVIYDEYDEQAISSLFAMKGHDGFSLPAWADADNDERYTVVLNRTALRVVR
jgi:hypothetical protein